MGCRFGQPIKVNWAYASGQREDTSGWFRVNIRDLCFEQIVTLGELLLKILYNVFFLNLQAITTYLLVTSVLRLLMLLFLHAFLSTKVVRKLHSPMIS
jgi:ABC-type thiamin/hydroxymethylpyrimidine transport system permease subunit